MDSYDVVVVGAGAAGLNGALALVRSRRSVLVIDSGEPRNAPAGHVHNFLTRDGTPPGEIYAIGRQEVRRYGGRVEQGTVTAIRRDDERFRIDLADGSVTARRVLVATGVRDELPDVAGLAEHWGQDVVHCPYCHGWEVRDRRIGVLATGPMATHQALLFRQLSDRVTMLAHTAMPTAQERERLTARAISIVAGKVTQVEGGPAGLTGVRLADGERVEVDALVVASRPVARVDFLAPLGITPQPVRVGDYVVATAIEADRAGATAVPGVWAAGNVADPMAQVVSAAAAGLMAGAAINGDLVTEETDRAVRAAPVT